MLAGLDTVARRFDAVNRDIRVVEERVEQTHRVRPAADTRDQRVGQPALGLHHLLAGFAPDDRLKVAHQFGIGMRSGDRADDVEGRLDIGHPVAQRLVQGIFERMRARRHGNDLSAQEFHAKDIGCLAFDILGAHVDNARQADLGTHSCRRDAVLAGPGFRDDPLFAHALGEQDLAHGVVDLVRAGVVELVALEIDLGAAQVLGQPFGEVERAGAADIMFRPVIELGLKAGVGFGLVPGLFQVQNERHQRFGHITAAEHAEMALFVRTATISVHRFHGVPYVV